MGNPLQPLLLKQNDPTNAERGAIIGQSGTGKSVLAKYLLPMSGALAIIDPKRLFDFPGVPVYDSSKQLFRYKPSRFVYRPKPSAFGDLQELNEVYRYCYERGNIFVYTDDLVGILQNTRFPKYLGICYMMGREHGVTMLSCFQRPSCIPPFMTSECTRFYVFRIIRRQDVDTIRAYVSEYDVSRLTDHHTFLFQNLKTMTDSQPWKLKLPERG